jgi:pilus assembly protein CpaC
VLGQPPSQGAGPENVPGSAIQPTPEAEAKEAALITEVLEPELTLDLDPQRSKIVRTRRPVTRISITNPEIVEVVEFGPSEFELIGGQSGQTSLTLWFGDGQQGEMLRYLIRVSPDEAIEDRRKIEYGDLQRKINELFPDSVVHLIPVADKLLVRGQARDAEEAAEIMGVLRGDAPTSDGYYLTSVVEGTAAEPYPGIGNLPQSSVIDMLHVPGEMQVLLKVRVAELSRSAMRRMGADLDVFWNDFSFFSFLGLDGPVRAVLDRDEIKLTLEAIASNSYAKVLAEPNLVTLSGHPAYFIAGGEFAVPMVVGVEGAAASTTRFRGFGTQLTFVPTVLDKDRIRLRVAPSLSSLNQENAVDGIPGLNTRAVATTVDLREGQWLAIAGLLQDQQEGGKTRVPFVGDLPYLDTLFSSKRVKRDETELLVLVSPELVHPLEAEEAPAILPGMEVTEPNDWGFYFEGRIEGRTTCDHRSTVWPVGLQQSLDGRRQAKRHGGYQACESYYIEGEHGFSQ